MKKVEKIELALEKKYGKIIIKSFTQFHGGYKRQVAGGILSPVNPGMMYLFENYFVFTADIARKQNSWEIVIPLKSILSDYGKIDDVIDSKSEIKNPGVITTPTGKKLFVIPYNDENGIYQEPRFGIISMPGWKKALGCAAMFGGGGLTKWNQVFFDHFIKWRKNNPGINQQTNNLEKNKEKFDIFISHASEDKENVAAPLAKSLADSGLKVWYDDFSLEWGDSLMKSINHGLSNSLFGIVIFSKNFLEKKWPQLELEGLLALTKPNEKKILPLRYEMSHEEMQSQFPVLAGILSRSWDDGLENLVNEISKMVKEKKKSDN